MRPRISCGCRLAQAWRVVREEQGVALVLAILTMLVLLVTLTAVILLTAAGARDAQRTNAGQKAHALAESGINDALAVLNANYPATYPGDKCLLHDQPALSATFPGNPIPTGSACPSSSPFAVTPDSSRPLETISFWGALRVAVPGTVWIVRATGSVPNPTGPGAAPITRTLTVKVPVTIPTSSPGGNGVLDWVYSGQNAVFPNSVEVSSPLYVNGDITFQNTATVHAPLYVTGDVTFENNGSIDGTKCPNPTPTGHPGCLNIGGNLDLQKNGDNVGSSAQPLPEVHIVGSCKYQSVIASPCGHTPPTPAWTATNVFAPSTPPEARNNTLQPRPFPPMTTSNDPTKCADITGYSCLDFDKWYQAASPGPWDPCPGLPAATFDNDALGRNNSIPTSFNLTPSTPYTCTTPAGGTLTWDPNDGDGKLTVIGTVYIDGSAYIGPSGSKVYRYEGVGAIWLSGSFSMSNDTMCAVLTSNKKHCDVSPTSGWKPEDRALAIIADGNGYAGGPTAANVPVGDSADIKSSEFQGILAGSNTVNMDTSSQVQGPIMSVNAAVTPSQSLNLTFPPVPFAPSSSPGQPPPKAVLLAPREYGG